MGAGCGTACSGGRTLAAATAAGRNPCCCPHPPNPRFAGLPSDRVLPDDPTCRPIIERYAADQQAFFNDFAAAYVRLTMLGARWA